jgi:hypothetical protein
MTLLTPARLKFNPNLIETLVPCRSPMGSLLEIGASTIIYLWEFLPSTQHGGYLGIPIE